MIAGLLIIIIFPFIYFYTQMNNFNQKTNTIRKAIKSEKETYYDITDGHLHWTQNGDAVMYWTWAHQERSDVIKGDEVICNLKMNKIYKNLTQERYKSHIQFQIDTGKCWCYERHEYNNPIKNDLTLRYHIEDKYFYYLIKESKDDRLRLYCKKNTGEKRQINFEEYIRLGGSELSESEYKKKNGYTLTTFQSKTIKKESKAFDYNDIYLQEDN